MGQSEAKIQPAQPAGRQQDDLYHLPPDMVAMLQAALDARPDPTVTKITDHKPPAKTRSKHQ